jgi:AmiR/NasT family two-component response regulator
MADTHLRVIIYTPDEAAADVLRGIVGEHGEVVTHTRGDLLPASLVLVDLALPKSADLLSGLILARSHGRLETAALAVVSANPFVIRSLPREGVDALIAKPLQTEQVQALLVGVRARLSA